LNKNNLLLKIIFIFFSFIYSFEFILSYKTHNFNYLIKKIFDKNLISVKMIDDYILSDNNYLTLDINKKYQFFCDYKKMITVKTDKYGLVNNNEKWNTKNQTLLLQTNGDLNCGNFHLTNSSIRFKTDKMLNFGSFSIGPMHQYALIKRYLNKAVFKKVVWMHYEGSDLSERNNLKNSYLINILNDKNFVNNFSVIDKNDNFEKFIKIYNYKIFKRTLKNFITIYHTRVFINKKNKFKSDKKNNIKEIKIKEIDEFINILIKTQKLLDKNLTNIYFVYIPSINEVFTSEKDKLIKKKIKEELFKNGIKFINLKQTNFNNDDQLLMIDKFLN
jgi:hypothetical protein